MGRAERRKLEKKIKHIQSTKPWEFQTLIKDEYKRFVIDSRLNKDVLAPGDKVMLDADKILNDPDWKNFKPEYQEYVRNHLGEVFTLRQEAKVQGPFAFVSFEEDETDPKWLWFTGFVKKVHNGQGCD